jgi:hypothetical protein
MLLTKKGPSGTLADGEVAAYKALDRFLSRAQPPLYDKELQELSAEDVERGNTLLQETQTALQTNVVSTSALVKQVPVVSEKKDIAGQKRPREDAPPTTTAVEA